jgi:hypothetical protein
MKSSDARVAHFIGDRMVAITRQTVDTSSYQEMRSDFLPRAKEFIDVALAIADMNAFLWFTEKHCRLLEFSNHRMLSFFSIGTRVELIFLLSVSQPLNFFLV